MIALWLAAGLLASSGAEPPAPDPIGGGGSFDAAAQEWESRREWVRKAKDLIAELDAPEAQAPEADTQEQAPSRPTPVLEPYVPPALLEFDRLLSADNSHAQMLLEAIARRDALAVAEAAWAAEMALLADEQAIVALLMMEIA